MKNKPAALKNGVSPRRNPSRHCLLVLLTALGRLPSVAIAAEPGLSLPVRPDNADVVAYRAPNLDQQAAKLLGETTRLLMLKTTTIREIAPAYSVEKAGDLAWPEALVKADATFHGDLTRQLLFLRKYLPTGSPATCLSLLPKKPDPYSFGMPGRMSTSFTLAPPGADAASQNEVHYGPSRPSDPPTVELRFIVGPSGVAIVEPGAVILQNFRIAVSRYDELTFGLDDKLTSFTRTVGFPAMNLKLVIQGNTTGPDGTNYFSAVVMDENGRWQQVISFSPALEITWLYVYDPLTSKPRYREEYEAGTLRRRIHYGERETAQGTEQIVTTTQEF